MSATDNITLNCLVWGEDMPFSVEVVKTARVCDLQTKIKQTAEITLPAHVLRLFQVSLSTGKQLKRDLSGLQLETDESLNPMDGLSDVFTQGVITKRVQIVVKKPEQKPDQKPEQIALNCLVWGKDMPFGVSMLKTARVCDLQTEIKQRAENTFRDIDAYDLCLFQVSLPVDKQLKQALSSLKLGPDARLGPLDQLSSVFQNVVSRNDIHVLVKKPDPSMILQEQVDQVYAMVESFKRAVTLTSKMPAPSTAAKSTEYAKIQSGPQRILDCRVPANNSVHTVGPPIQLFNPAFAYFSSKAFDPGYVVPNDFVRSVRHLIDQFSRIYPNENIRQFHVKSALAMVLGNDFTKVVNPDRTTPDYVMRQSCGRLLVSLVVGEEKNELGDGGSDPSVQAAFSFQNLVRQKENSELLHKCCCPSFIIAHAGPWLTIMGGILTGDCVVQRLIDYLWVPPHSTHDNGQYSRIARVLYALRQSIRELRGWYTAVQTLPGYDPEHPSVHPRFFPSPNTYKQDDGKLIQFEYQVSLEDNISCVTYRAKTLEENSQDIVVKFVTSYGGDAHRELAPTFAPELLYYGPIDVMVGMPSYGDLRMVVMKYVDGLTLEEAKQQERVPPNVKDDLKRAMDRLHGAGYVFGDLRSPNVIVTPEGPSTVQLIDFDWAGKEGEVEYPVTISNSIGWPEGVRGLDPILKEHDLAMLRSLLKSHC